MSSWLPYKLSHSYEGMRNAFSLVGGDEVSGMVEAKSLTAIHRS
ncbi:hypothetical protein ACFY5J_28610 [Peribacillus butanolivorans]